MRVSPIAICMRSSQIQVVGVDLPDFVSTFAPMVGMVEGKSNEERPRTYEK